MNDIIIRYYDIKMILNRSIDICLPKGNMSETALLYIHGGGWQNGSKDQYHSHLQYFSGLDYVSASLGYRLVPEVTFSDQIKDILEGYDCFVSYVKEKRLNINKIVIVGGSAGAHLAALIALLPPNYFNKNIRLKNKWIKPTACISINGPGTLEKWPNMNEHLKKCIQNLVGSSYEEKSNIFKEISPITHVDENTPPFLFLLAGKEKFFPHRYVIDMCKKIKKYGIYAEYKILKEAEHGFSYDLENINTIMAVVIMEEFINKVSKLNEKETSK